MKNLIKNLKWVFSNKKELKQTLKANWGLFVLPFILILWKSWVAGLILLVFANISNFFYALTCRIYKTTFDMMKSEIEEQHQKYMRLASTVFGAKVTKSNLNN